MWYVRPAKPQISLCIRAVWSEPLLVAWIFYECWSTDWTWFGVSKSKRRLQRLVQVYTCQNVKLLEISCRGSIILCISHVLKWFLIFFRRFQITISLYLEPPPPGKFVLCKFLKLHYMAYSLVDTFYSVLNYFLYFHINHYLVSSKLEKRTCINVFVPPTCIKFHDSRVNILLYLSRDMWFPTMWYFDMNRLGRACAASF